MTAQVPVVDFLVLEDGPPHLAGRRCDECGATYLERRNACASCGERSFTAVRLPEGRRWRDALAGREAAARDGTIAVGEALADFPVALLVGS